MLFGPRHREGGIYLIVWRKHKMAPGQKLVRHHAGALGRLIIGLFNAFSLVRNVVVHHAVILVLKFSLLYGAIRSFTRCILIPITEEKKSLVAERNGLMGYMSCSAYQEKLCPHIAHWQPCWILPRFTLFMFYFSGPQWEPLRILICRHTTSLRDTFVVVRQAIVSGDLKPTIDWLTCL